MNIAISQPGTVSTATQLQALGTPYRDQYGRSFRYAEAGGTLLTRGRMTVESTVTANHINLSWATAPTAGDRTVDVTLGATAAAADLYKDGWLVVQDATGEGRIYPIEGHAAAASAGTITLRLNEAIDTTGVLSETGCDLIRNTYKDVVITVTDQADPPVGVPTRNITADQFGWVQTYGPCAIWFDEAVTAGQQLAIGTGTAGQVELLDAAGETSLGFVGATAGVDTEYQLCRLQLDY